MMPDQAAFEAYIALVNRYVERNMTDGLPVIPPAAEAVAAMCAATGLPPEHVVGSYPIRPAPVTVKDIAVNALMAGCLPEYMPIVLAAHEAMFTKTARGGDAFGVNHMTQTASTQLPAMVVNGPIRHQLGLKCRADAFGPGSRASAAIGRALRLSFINLAYGIPTAAGRSCVGSTYRLTMIVGEDEEHSPWPALHTELGFQPEDSTVITMKVCQPEQFILRALSPEQLLDAILDRLTVLTYFADGMGIHRDEPPPEGGGRNLILLGEEHRSLLAGWSRDQIRDYLTGEGGAARRGRTVGELRSVGYVGWATRFTEDDPDSKFIRRRLKPENIAIGSVGGPGWSSMLLPYPPGSGASGFIIKKLHDVTGRAGLANVRAGFQPARGGAGLKPAPTETTKLGRSPMVECIRLVERAMESGIGDGLPILPPDVKAVEAMVEASGRRRSDVLGRFQQTIAGEPIFSRAFTVGEVAATAQIAGCLPEYMPVLVTALEILLEPRHDMFRVLSTVDGAAPLIVLNGPVRTRLDVNGWRDAFGPWKRSNAAMGRALNLCLRNIGGLSYEIGLGTASHYTGIVIAEFEEESPWAPLHTDYGFDASDSTVMVLDCATQVYSSNHQTPHPEQFLKSIADSLSTLDNFDPSSPHQGWVMTIGGDLRIHLRNAGWTRRQVQDYVLQTAGRTAGELRARGFGHVVSPNLRDGEFVRLLRAAEDVIPISLGGGGAITHDCRGRLLGIRKLPD